MSKLTRLTITRTAFATSLATPTTSEAHPSATAFGVGERSGPSHQQRCKASQRSCIAEQLMVSVDQKTHPLCLFYFVLLEMSVDQKNSWRSLKTKKKNGDENRRFLCSNSLDYASGPAFTRALPASLPVYLTKFLTKRPARSFAFASQSPTFW